MLQVVLAVIVDMQDGLGLVMVELVERAMESI
jgi:hypothetical protein